MPAEIPSRSALEGFVSRSCGGGRSPSPNSARCFNQGCLKLDGFLKAHGIFQEYTLEDFEAERQALKEIGF